MTTVVVGICTYRRNGQLAALLEVLASVASARLSAVELIVLVVDDDPAGGAEALVAEHAARFDGSMVYRHSGSSNLSTARNAVIEAALPLADWLAFIDDDCLPATDWLQHLLAVQQETGADIVTGHVVYRARPEAPAWLLDEPFCDFTAYEDGAEPEYGNTANVLFRTAFLRESHVRFRPSLGLTGGEDMTFYEDARALGAKLRYAAKAIVFEELTPSRERLSYQLHRQFWLGNNMTVINRHTRREPMLRLLLRGAKRVLVAWAAPASRVAAGRPPQLRWALAYSLQGLGLILGVLGITIRHRS